MNGLRTTHPVKCFLRAFERSTVHVVYTTALVFSRCVFENTNFAHTVLVSTITCKNKKIITNTTTTTATMKQFNCDADVKTKVSRLINHNRCTKKCKGSKYLVPVSGSVLNNFLHPTYCSAIHTGSSRCNADKPFISQKKYLICQNLHRTLQNPLPTKYHLNPNDRFCIEIPGLEKGESPAQSSNGPNAKKSTSTPPIEQQPNQSTDQHKSRSDRLFLRKRIPTKDLKGIKQIKVSIEDDDDFIVDLTSPHFRKRKPYIQIFKEDVLSKPNYYKVPFGKLTMKQKRLRMKDLSKKILSACIDRQSYRQDSDQYIQGNEELAVDLVSLLDGMKKFLQSKIKLNLNQYSDTPMRPIENDSEGSIRLPNRYLNTDPKAPPKAIMK